MPPRPFALAAFAALLLPTASFAHGLHIKATVADPVRVEAWFDGDDPVERGRVLVRDAAGGVILTGTTDDRGVWTFPRPGPGRYTVRVEVAGHEQETEPFEIGGPGPDAVESRRPNRVVGALVGMGVLLGLSLLVWRRGRAGAGRV